MADPPLWLTVYGPLLACVLFSFFLLVFAHKRFAQLGMKDRRGLRRLIVFVGAFFVTWCFPAACRLYQLVCYVQTGTVVDVPEWLALGHSVGMGAAGMGGVGD